MSKKTDKALDEVKDLIDDLSATSNMTKEEAREFYEDLGDLVSTMLDALGED